MLVGTEEESEAIEGISEEADTGTRIASDALPIDADGFEMDSEEVFKASEDIEWNVGTTGDSSPI